jgi:hypothetical protein
MVAVDHLVGDRGVHDFLQQRCSECSTAAQDKGFEQTYGELAKGLEPSTPCLQGLAIGAPRRP